MKLIILAAFLLGSVAEAKTLVCASRGEENIYYTEGKLTLTAKVVDAGNLENIKFTVLPKDKLWSVEGHSAGYTRRGYTRFLIGGDAWCSYQAALPEHFDEAQGWFPLFLDAYCEEEANSSHRLNCRLR